MLFRQGDRGELIYFIESGFVEVYRELASGSIDVLARIEPGNYVGELGPILNLPRSASVRAVADTVVIGYTVRIPPGPSASHVGADCVTQRFRSALTPSPGAVWSPGLPFRWVSATSTPMQLRCKHALGSETAKSERISGASSAQAVGGGHSVGRDTRREVTL